VENPNCLAHTAYSGVARLAASSIAENADVTIASATRRSRLRPAVLAVTVPASRFACPPGEQG
jgi:hypothetical protein